MLIAAFRKTTARYRVENCVGEGQRYKSVSNPIEVSAITGYRQVNERHVRA